MGNCRGARASLSCATLVATSVQDDGSVDAFDGDPSELKPGRGPMSFAESDEADAR
jgi:hypothetical protein